MADYQLNDTQKDVLLQDIKDNVTKMVLCDAAPDNYTDANTDNGVSTGVKLAEVTLVSGDFTIADASPDGRKVTVAAKPGISVGAAGDGTHVALLDVANTAVVAVTKLSTPRDSLTTDDTVDFPAWFIRLRDAVAAA